MSGIHQATNADALTPVPRPSTFWTANAVFWSVYAVALMIPWIGRYPITDMLPNKIAIAAAGVGVSGALKAFYGWMRPQPIPRLLFVWLAFLACAAGAVTLDATVIALTQGPEAIPLRWEGSFGSILGGVPFPGRVGQYLTLLVAWSLGLHVLTQGKSSSDTADVTPATTAGLPVDATLAVIGSSVRARDGHRTILLDRDEIEWIAADGDYIRIHSGTKDLLIRATMKHSSGILAPLGFVRVHRSAIVNPRHVREVVRDGDEQSVLLRNGARIRAGRNYASELDRLLGSPPNSAG